MSTITIKANYHSLLQLINGAEAHESKAVFTLLKCCRKTTYVINILCGKVYPFLSQRIPMPMTTFLGFLG
jgi:hypothetical protein